MKLALIAEDGARIGTVELDAGRVRAEPTFLRELVMSRVARGMTLEQAFTDLRGWSNGYEHFEVLADDAIEKMRRRSRL